MWPSLYVFLGDSGAVKKALCGKKSVKLFFFYVLKDLHDCQCTMEVLCQLNDSQLIRGIVAVI